MILKMHEGGPEIESELGQSPTQPARMWQHPTRRGPLSVAIVACGPTQQTWHAAHSTYEPQVPKTDEVWSLNKGLRTVRCDLGFVLDDMVGEARRSDDYAEDLRGVSIPLITSTLDDEVRRLFPASDLHPLPINEILWDIGFRFARSAGHNIASLGAQLARPDGDPVKEQAWDNFRRVMLRVGYYFHNSVPMMLAYAMFIGVRKVYLFGADYTFPGQAMREDDRANCEYWVGFLRAQGVEVQVPEDTTLLNSRRQPWLYGYGARPPVLTRPHPTDVSELVGRYARARHD